VTQPSASALLDTLPGSPVRPIRPFSLPTSSLDILILPETVSSGVLKLAANLGKNAFGNHESLRNLTSSLFTEDMFSDQLPSKMANVLLRKESPTTEFLQIIVFLISNGFLETSHSLIRSIFKWLQNEKNTGFLKYLLSMEGPTFDSLREQAFRNAIQEGDAPIINSLLDAGMDPNKEICYDSQSGECITPICCASFYGHLEVVKILISAGADPNKTIDGSEVQETALQQAMRGFKARHTRIDRNNYSYRLIQALFDAKVDVNSAKGSSVPALLLAIRLCPWNTIVIDLLLLKGATVHSKRPGNCTPLFLYIKHSHGWSIEDEVIRICGDLINAGDDVNAICSNSGSSVLHETIGTGSIKLLRLILGAGAKVDSSAIGLACSVPDIRLAMLLADARVNGASPVSATAAYIYNTEYLTLTYEPERSDTHLRFVQEAISLLPITAREDYVNLISQAASRSGQDGFFETMRAVGAAGPSDLMEAVRQKDFRHVQMFLRVGANANGRCCITGTTVLHEAIERNNNKAVIRALINAGADINAPSPKYGVNYTPVMLAIKRGNNELVQILVDAAADLNTPSGDCTALSLAVGQYIFPSGDEIQREFIRYLLRKGANPDDSFALRSAICYDMGILDIIFDARSLILAQRKKLDDSVLQKAVCLSNFLAVRKLLEHVSAANDPDPRVVSLKPIQHFKCTSATNSFGVAISRHKYDVGLLIVRLLLQAGADPDSVVNTDYRESAFTMAIAEKNFDLINLLIDAGAMVNAPAGDGIRFTPLQAAANGGSLELVQKLRELGADVNAPPAERSGATALQLAAMRGYIGIARYLLDEGADVNVPPAKINGRTALEVAAEQGRIDMIRFLVNAGAKIHGPGSEQYSRALDFASRNGKRAARRCLESIHAQHLDHSPETFMPDDSDSGHIAN
jgi:ankyrin repeat protein